MSLPAVAQGTIQLLEFAPETVQTDQVLLWDRMSAEQRAQLWRVLNHEQRLRQWRYMSKEERRQMRRHMTATERRAIKDRYVVDGKACPSRPVPKMTPAERELLRQQVMQVHVEIHRGVPYNCTDPTDCPKSAFRMRVAERSEHDEITRAARESLKTLIVVPSVAPAP